MAGPMLLNTQNRKQQKNNFLNVGQIKKIIVIMETQNKKRG